MRIMIAIAALLSFLPAISAGADGLSFTEQCPTLLKMADDFVHECITKARTRSYQALGDFNGHMVTISGTVYFLPAEPGSHFSLGCVLNENDKTKIDYFGVYYATKDSNFAVADTDKAEWRNVTLSGDVGLIVEGEPMNFVLVRPFDTGSLPFSDQGFGIRPMLKNGRVKNCESPTLPDGSLMEKFLHIERTESNDKITIKSCFGPVCHFSKIPNYDTFVAEKNAQNIDKDDAFNPSADYIRFFSGKDHEIIYSSSLFTFFMESGGGLLIRNDVLKTDCGAFNYLMRGSRNGNFNIPNIAQEVCNLHHQPDPQ